MTDAFRELIPHAPDLGLYVAPDIPDDKLRAALKDYAPSVRVDEVIALFDATLLGSAKDGAVFTADRFVFQNNDLQAPRQIRYEDIVRVLSKKKFFGGRRIQIDVNRGRATVEAVLDFSGRPGAAEYVARFLHEAMMNGIQFGSDRVAGADPGTDRQAVQAALDALVDAGSLSSRDRTRMLGTLE